MAISKIVRATAPAPAMMLAVSLALSLALSPVGAAMQARGTAGFRIENASGSDWGAVRIRRSGTTAWTALVGPLAAGKSAVVGFTDPDCAFDIEAGLVGGGRYEWMGVNLCEVRVVRLNRNGAGVRWVDYD